MNKIFSMFSMKPHAYANESSVRKCLPKAPINNANSKLEKLLFVVQDILIVLFVAFIFSGCMAAGTGNPTEIWSSAVDIIQKLLTVAGIGCMIFGVIEIFWSLASSNPDAKNAGIRFAACGLGVTLASQTLIPMMKVTM